MPVWTIYTGIYSIMPLSFCTFDSTKVKKYKTLIMITDEKQLHNLLNFNEHIKDASVPIILNNNVYK